MGVIDSGVSVTGHGDHSDVDVKAPRMTGVSITGAKPSHVNMDSERVAVFFDGDGQASVVSGESLLSGKAKPSTIKAAAPHHGLAAPLGAFTAVSIPHPTDAKELRLASTCAIGPGSRSRNPRTAPACMVRPARVRRLRSDAPMACCCCA